MDRDKTKQIREEFKQLESPNARLIDKQMEIAAQISRYLREQGITQKELAKKANIGESQLSEILRGEANPTLKTLVKLEEALGRDVIVAPLFYKEDLEKKGFLHVNAQETLEETWLESFDEIFNEIEFIDTIKINTWFEELSVFYDVRSEEDSDDDHNGDDSVKIYKMAS